MESSHLKRSLGSRNYRVDSNPNELLSFNWMASLFRVTHQTVLIISSIPSLTNEFSSSSSWNSRYSYSHRYCNIARLVRLKGNSPSLTLIQSPNRSDWEKGDSIGFHTFVRHLSSEWDRREKNMMSSQSDYSSSLLIPPFSSLSHQLKWLHHSSS